MKEFLRKIDLWIGENLYTDDLLHFSVSLIITAFMYVLVLSLWGRDGELGVASLLAVMGTMTLGFIKEAIIDNWIKGTEASERDLLADALGALAMAAIMALFDAFGLLSDPYMGCL